MIENQTTSNLMNAAQQTQLNLKEKKQKQSQQQQQNQFMNQEQVSVIVVSETTRQLKILGEQWKINYISHII